MFVGNRGHKYRALNVVLSKVQSQSYLFVVVRIEVVLIVGLPWRLHLRLVGVQQQRLLEQRRADWLDRDVFGVTVSSPRRRRRRRYRRGTTVDQEPTVHVGLGRRLVVALLQLLLLMMVVLGRVVRVVLLVAEQLVRFGLQLLRVRGLLPNERGLFS